MSSNGGVSTKPIEPINMNKHRVVYLLLERHLSLAR